MTNSAPTFQRPDINLLNTPRSNLQPRTIKHSLTYPFDFVNTLTTNRSKIAKASSESVVALNKTHLLKKPFVQELDSLDLIQAMRLLRRNDVGEIRLIEIPPSENAPRYAILSHTWCTEEVTFSDMIDGTGKSKPSYQKIQFCGDQAWRDGLQHFWVDTCCINKSDSTELQEAITSMFRWYRGAEKCYVYLADVSTSKRDADGELSWNRAFQKSRWFTRGWTLQELIAPASVEFFSKEGVRLGDKTSLEQDIYHITNLPPTAIQGNALSEFSIDERLAWIEKRDTTRKEDKAYSLLGIFNIHMPLIYGEGEENAFRRLREEIDKATRDAAKNAECLRHLRVTDPRDDKIRMEQTKGGLFNDSYRWILDNADFRRWRNDKNSRLLWIKGDPGKGKTMLLCGIIDELEKMNDGILSYFFCQATDSRINSAISVLRGLIYLLVESRMSLLEHVRKKYDTAGKQVFEDANAWVALSGILASILETRSETYLVIDALDECLAGLPDLLAFIVEKSSAYPHIKWLVSGRNWPDIEAQLDRTTQKIRLCLELNQDSISAAVSKYIHYKVAELAKLKNYDDQTRDAVQNHLSSHANDTFLWVALVCQELGDPKVQRWHTRQRLHGFPPDLDALYWRMMKQIDDSTDAVLYKQILAVVSTVYRPITLPELGAFVDLPKGVTNDESFPVFIRLCGSFLVLREGTVYFVHQSAKDFLLGKAFHEIFPRGTYEVHRTIFSRSIKVMTEILRRDMYRLGHPGFPIEKVEIPAPDPLAAARYSCVYWIEHLVQANAEVEYGDDIQDGGRVDEFLRQKYLYWLECLSLLNNMSEGVMLLSKLLKLLDVSLHIFRALFKTGSNVV